MTSAVKRIGKQWWVVGIKDVPPMGPYDTKAEAESDRVGVARFLRNEDKQGYMTSCKRSTSKSS